MSWNGKDNAKGYCCEKSLYSPLIYGQEKAALRQLKLIEWIMADDWRSPVVDFTALVALICFAAAMIT